MAWKIIWCINIISMQNKDRALKCHFARQSLLCKRWWMPFYVIKVIILQHCLLEKNMKIFHFHTNVWTLSILNNIKERLSQWASCIVVIEYCWFYGNMTETMRSIRCKWQADKEAGFTWHFSHTPHTNKWRQDSPLFSSRAKVIPYIWLQTSFHLHIEWQKAFSGT